MIDDEYRAKIDAHVAAQTCSICGKHLDYLQGYHSTSHAHWTCHEREDQHFRALLGLDKEPTAPACLRPATIKGMPWRTHLLPSDEQTAICGAKPGRSRARRMVDRTGWYVYKDRETAGRPVCIECTAAEHGWLTKHGAATAEEA